MTDEVRTAETLPAQKGLLLFKTGDMMLMATSRTDERLLMAMHELRLAYVSEIGGALYAMATPYGLAVRAALLRDQRNT